MMFSHTNLSDNSRYLEELYHTYRTPMFRLARSILSDDMDAEDAVHDVFYKIVSKHLAKIRSISSPEDLRNYLLKAVKNTALGYIARQSNNNQSLESLCETDSLDSEPSDDDFLETICIQEEYDRVLEAINSLKPTYHDIIYFYFVHEYSVPQIAEILGRNAPTVKVQLARGKKLLLEALNKGGTKQ